MGGRGISGSANSLLVGVSTLGYPSGPADPLDSAIASATDVQIAADSTLTSSTTGSRQVTSRQPPTATEVTAAASRSPTVASSVVDTPARGRRRSSSVTLSPPILSPAYDTEQLQSVPLRIGRAASSQRRSQRPPSLSPTQWTGSYGSPSPPIGSAIETDYPAARPSVYQPWSTGVDKAPLQVGADIRQSGSTIDPRVHIPEMSTFVSLAAEVQPDSQHVVSTPILSSDIGLRGDAGHSLSEGVDVARPPPTHAIPTPTQTPTSMSAGLMSAAHAVYPSSVGAHVPRPTLADDESVRRQSAYTGQYAAVCTGLQVQTSAETLTAQSLLLLGRCPTSPHSSHSSVHDWLQATGTHAPRLAW